VQLGGAGGRERARRRAARGDVALGELHRAQPPLQHLARDGAAERQRAHGGGDERG